MNHDGTKILMRAFKGHTVGACSYAQGGLTCRVLELSFLCPRGLSGAPLRLNNKVVGVIVGNRITEQEVYSEREVDRSGQRETLFVKTEAMHLGLAVNSNEILQHKSLLLGMTIADFLKSNRLL